MNRVGWYTYPYNPHILVGTYAAFPHHGGFRYMVPVTTHPVAPDHPISSQWDVVSGRIIEILDRVGTQWVAVECFERRQVHNDRHRGEYAEIRETTVLITVQEFPYIDSDYKKILHEIYECSGGLFIELLGGTVWCGATETAYGWSINVRDLRFPDASDDKGGKLWGPYGGNLSSNTYVATDGIDKSLGNFSCYLLLSKPGERFASDVKECWKNIRIRCPTTQEFAIDTFGKLVDDPEYEDEEEEHIGNVLASSGLAVSKDDNCRLDWAVVLCQPGKCGKNVSMGNVHRNTTTVTIDSWARPTGNSESYLAGRREKGYLNTVKSCICYRNAGQETRTKEWAAIGGCKGHFVYNDPCGQLVVGKSNDEALGVVWGGTRSKLTIDVAAIYITPLHIIAQGIREATGYDVSLAGGSKIV
ncbi:hypothetical protein TRV_01790 [Trichophyton verrucosum HKI 0517]|uniref:Uncharacterized protein n=1 Tax=Trichophyton verrucosum (strain HKI 0517) TaxID=663202 RepID=D4D3X7_TRIVH|nr:uncharacterized protein TRV_01790 [Trichophyton verrucosum HKI 0517]EFE43405.1 hypothetical protein TRV_01790 [Trichophyton verrucosum HKI 0517]